MSSKAKRIEQNNLRRSGKALLAAKNYYEGKSFRDRLRLGVKYIFKGVLDLW